MGHAHPVERAVSRRRRRVEVKPAIDVDQTGRVMVGAQRGNSGKGNSAISADHEHRMPCAHERSKAARQLGEARRHGVGILRERMFGIGSPYLYWQGFL